MNRLVRWLKRPVTLNYATVIFCFLQGAVLSIPAAYLLRQTRPFDPPMILSIICMFTAYGAAILLPFWSLLVIAKTETSLAILGFVSAMLAIAFGSLLQVLG